MDSVGELDRRVRDHGSPQPSGWAGNPSLDTFSGLRWAWVLMGGAAEMLQVKMGCSWVLRPAARPRHRQRSCVIPGQPSRCSLVGKAGGGEYQRQRIGE